METCPDCNAYQSTIEEMNINGVGGKMRYLNQLRTLYGPCAPVADVIAREQARLGIDKGGCSNAN